MNYPMLKTQIADFFSGMMPTTVDNGCLAGANETAASASTAGRQPEDSPFVLVTHTNSGKWDVFACDFDNSLASFDARQAACDFASKLAGTCKDSMVLIQDQHKSAAALPSLVPRRELPGFFVRMGRS